MELAPGMTIPLRPGAVAAAGEDVVAAPRAAGDAPAAAGGEDRVNAELRTEDACGVDVCGVADRDTIYAICVEDGGGSAALGALLLGWKCVGYVEHDESSIETIARNIAAGVLDDVPIFRGRMRDIVRCGHAEPYCAVAGSLAVVWPGWCDITCAERFEDLRECLRAFRPRLVLVEGDPDSEQWLGNVEMLLATFGYDAEWDCVPASACGAPFARERRWVVAERSADAGAGSIAA